MELDIVKKSGWKKILKDADFSVFPFGEQFLRIIEAWPDAGSSVQDGAVVTVIFIIQIMDVIDEVNNFLNSQEPDILKF